MSNNCRKQNWYCHSHTHTNANTLTSSFIHSPKMSSTCLGYQKRSYLFLCVNPLKDIEITRNTIKTAFFHIDRAQTKININPTTPLHLTRAYSLWARRSREEQRDLLGNNIPGNYLTFTKIIAINCHKLYDLCTEMERSKMQVHTGRYAEPSSVRVVLE